MMQDGLQSDANSLDVLLSLADLYVQNGLIEEAKALLKTAIEQNKDAVDPYCSLGKIYLKEGNRGRAIKILKQAEMIDPENKIIQDLLQATGKEEVVEELKVVERVEKKGELEEVEEVSGVPLEDLIKRELDKLLKEEGIMGIILVDEGGSLIYAELNLPLDEESTGAIINTIYNRINETVKDFDLGDLKEVIFELPGGNIFVLGTLSIRFIVLVKRDIHIASLEGEIREIFERTKAILEVD